MIVISYSYLLLLCVLFVIGRGEGIEDEKKVCGENEEYTSCGSYCPATCDHSLKPCILLCRRGCDCKQGYVHESNDFKSACIHENECPKRRQRSACGENEEFLECGSACVDTCHHRPTICTQQCVSGCFCRSSDYVRANSSTESPCIARNECLLH